MRNEEEVRDQLGTARGTLENATMTMSQGRIESVDFSRIATAVGVIQALEWVLGDSDTLKLELEHPLRRPLEDI
jgi:hypothetical protein